MAHIYPIKFIRILALRQYNLDPVAFDRNTANRLTGTFESVQ
ncbi:MAG: hypothetical protein ABJP82_24940 [Hyphomicrobiales bacterium]